MEAFALGELQLRPAELWALSLREYLCMADGYHRRNVLQWHHTRLLATVLINLHREPKTPPVTPEQVMYLPGDVPPVVPGVMSEEEFDAMMARLDEMDGVVGGVLQGPLDKQFVELT